MKKRKKYSAETKAKAVLSFLKGEQTLVEIAKDLEIHPGMVSKWHQTFLEAAPAAFGQEDDSREKEEKIAELERMVGKLTAQNEFLKKASGRIV